MTIKIHHNTAKKAKAHKIELAVVDGEVVASKDGASLARGLVGNKVLDEAIAKIGVAARSPIIAKALGVKKPAKKAKRPVAVKDMDDEDFDEDGEPDPEDDEGEQEEGRSIIKHKYKKVYKPFKMTNGDDLNQLLAEHLKYQDEDGKMRIDVKKLVAFAKANDCWVDGYRHLNVGQQRLNVGNRLRAKIRKGHKVTW